MEIQFFKYQGTGNDFIMINAMNDELKLTKEQIEFLCHRKFGIGSDGLILIRPDEQTDFYVDFYNPDGSQSFCGNGSRCAVKFAQDHDIIQTKKTTFNAIDGTHEAELLDENQVRISMSVVSGIEKVGDDYLLNTGSPHYIVFCTALKELDIVTEARKIRYNERFKQGGVNVNFISREAEDEISIRTYERGVENETLSCGTGVTAAAISSVQTNGNFMIKVKSLGGDLKVLFTKRDYKFDKIFLEGAAQRTFKGSVSL